MLVTSSAEVGKTSGLPAAPLRRSYIKWLWLAIVPLAAILRFLFLSRKSVYLDEAISVAYAHMSWHEFLHVLRTRDFNMAFYYLLLRGFVIFGNSEFCVRLLSVIAGVATIPAVYWLGEKLCNRRTGLMASLIFSVNACAVVYSQEARGYALALLLIVLSSALFVTGLDSASWKIWLWYALVSALAVHSHFYAALVLVAQWLSLLALPRRMIPVKQLAAAVIFIAILILPAALFVLWHAPGHIDWVQPISWLEVYHTAVFLAAEGGKLAGNLLLAFCLFALVISAHATWHEIRTASPLDRWKTLFPWIWLLAPMAITAFGSIWTPMFFHRFLIVCLPAFVLLVTRGLMQVRASSVWVAAFAILSIVTVFLSYSRTRENWRDAVHYVLSQTQPGDAIWFYRDYAETPFEYYENRTTPKNYPERLSGENLPELHGEKRLWVVFYPVGSAGAAAIESKFGDEYTALSQSNFRGMHIVLFDTSRAR